MRSRCATCCRKIYTTSWHKNAHKSTNFPSLLLCGHPLAHLKAVVSILVLFFGAYVFNLCVCPPMYSAILYIYPSFLYFDPRAPSRRLKDSPKFTMSGSGGYYKYRCKYRLTYNCPNWVWVNNAPCAHCLVCLL